MFSCPRWENFLPHCGYFLRDTSLRATNWTRHGSRIRDANPHKPFKFARRTRSPENQFGAVSRYISDKKMRICAWNSRLVTLAES